MSQTLTAEQERGNGPLTAGGELEHLLDASLFGLGGLDVLGGHDDGRLDQVVVVVLAELLDLAVRQQLLKDLLELVRPQADRKLAACAGKQQERSTSDETRNPGWHTSEMNRSGDSRDDNGVVLLHDLEAAVRTVALGTLGRVQLDLASETLVPAAVQSVQAGATGGRERTAKAGREQQQTRHAPWLHGFGLLVVDEALEVGDDLAGVVVGDGGGVARADAVAAVDQDHGQHRAVKFGLDALPVLLLVLEQGVVVLVEDVTRHRRQLSEDVTRARGVLASLQARAELAVGHEQVDVVAAHEVLRHVDDGARERDLAVVVGRVLRHVARQLSNLDLALEVALEARKQNLALAGLQCTVTTHSASATDKHEEGQQHKHMHGP